MQEIKHKISSGVIRLYMLQMKYDGWTSFWNTIYYINKDMIEDEALKAHELTHIKQMQDEGKLKFAIKYLYYAWKYGYKENPYEIEARKVQARKIMEMAKKEDDINIVRDLVKHDVEAIIKGV
jgi:hypothetical protein